MKNSKPNVQDNARVILRNEHWPRQFWKMDCVVELIYSKDSEIRSAKVRAHVVYGMGQELLF